MDKFFKTVLLLLVFNVKIFGQGFVIEGFVFETGNRGYLNQAEIIIKDAGSGQVYCKTESNTYGQFKCDVPPLSTIIVSVTKSSYKPFEKKYVDGELKIGEKNFLKIEMTRAPGYLFEITLADKRENENQVVSAISDYMVEVFNNTTEKEILKLEHQASQEFKINLEKGNHYTILIRKENYFAKQMEVYVNVKGCILCFEGISDVRPGVTDNLTSSNEYGVLLANVEMEKVYSGKSIEIKNVLYESGSAALSPASKKELDKVVNLLKYNPNLTVQLISHTDSRGNAAANLTLSRQRATAAVQYVTDKGSIPSKKIYGVGLGEEYPKNQCKDGIICNEADHAINRRTEVKIISISEEWAFKPLVNIKNEEAFEKKLLEVTTSKVEEVTGEQLLGIKKTEAPNDSIVKSTLKNKFPRIVNSNLDTASNENLFQETGLKSEDPTMSEIKSDSILLDGHTIEEGIKILLYKSIKSHPKEKEWLSASPNLVIYKDAFGLINYIIGGYATIEEAQMSIQNKWRDISPQSKVVTFKEGRIID
jgi:outer membrane protein OmpA-like peptidoglycan-associated protein